MGAATASARDVSRHGSVIAPSFGGRRTRMPSSLALALAQSGPRGGWRRDASKPRRLPQQHKIRSHSELLPLSAGEQTHAQRALEMCGWESSQRATRCTWSSVWKKKARVSAREQRRPSREANIGERPAQRDATSSETQRREHTPSTGRREKNKPLPRCEITYANSRDKLPHELQ